MRRDSWSELERARHAVGGAGGGATARTRWRALFVLATVVFAAVVGSGAVSVATGVRAYAVVVVALAAAAAVRRVLAPFGRVERRRRRAPSSAAAEPAFLVRARERLELASAFAVHFEQLRTGLREVAEQRLAGHGVRLESERARALLGEDAWRLLAVPLERDKFAAGPPPAVLGRLLSAVEGL